MILIVNHHLQPFPSQTTSLFGGSSGVSVSPVAMGPVGVTSLPRNVNIHIHTGRWYLRNAIVSFLRGHLMEFYYQLGATLAPTASAVGNRAPNGEGMQGQPVNATEPADFGQAHDSTGINITGTAVQSQPITFSATGAVPTGTGVQQSPDSNSISSLVAEINSQIRSLIPHQSENHMQSESGMHTFKI